MPPNDQKLSHAKPKSNNNLTSFAEASAFIALRRDRAAGWDGGQAPCVVRFKTLVRAMGLDG